VIQVVVMVVMAGVTGIVMGVNPVAGTGGQRRRLRRALGMGTVMVAKPAGGTVTSKQIK
jgi:hypothetical protein